MKALRWVAALLLVVALGFLLLSDGEAAVADPGPPTAQTLAIARPLTRQVPAPGVGTGAIPLQLSRAELAALAQLGSATLAPTRVAADPGAGELVLRASRPAPFGRWWNGEVHVGADPLHPSLRLGSVPVPAVLANPLLRAAWKAVSARDPALPPLGKLVERVETSAAGVRARVDVNAARRLLDMVSAARGGGAVAPQAVAAALCRVSAASRHSDDFAALVAAALAGARDPDDARAALTALAAATAPEIARRLSPEVAPQLDRCPTHRVPLLGGRADLAKHWAVSAAITARVGAQASEALGTWKELSDSNRGGSGFSFVDLAADRSGFRWAAALTDPARFGAARDTLLRAEAARLVPPALLTAPEGMSSEQFEARWRDTDSAAYAASVAWIDRALDAVMR